jgi:transcription antitermination factor NusG
MQQNEEPVPEVRAQTDDARDPAAGTPDPPVPSEPAWYVLWTRSNCEQLVFDQLVAKGFDVFFPTLQTWSRAGGRRQRLCRLPMFRGYLFLHHALDRRSDVELRKARGVVAILGDRWDRRAAVPGAEIEAIRTLVRSGEPAFVHPYLHAGQRVRITSGPLADVEGLLVRTRTNRGTLVLSVTLLRHSVAVEIDGTLARPV